MRCVLLLASLAMLASGVSTLAGQIIDITRYGAVANDGKDDWAAIAAAIKAAGPGDTIKIPAGEFDISRGIVCKSNISLLGAGARSSMIKFIGSASTNLVSLDGVSNVTIAGVTLDGNDSAHAAQGIWSRNSSGLNLHDLAVENLNANGGLGPQGVYFASKVTHSVIANSTFSNIGLASRWGAGIRIGRGSSNNQVLSNTITNTGRGGILCDDHSTNLVIRKNTIRGSGRTAEGLGIELWKGCSNSIVEDNTLDHWLSLDASNCVAVRRNTISDKSGTYRFCGLEVVDSQNDIFTDNTVDGGQKIGVSESGTGPKRYLYFGHNTIKAASTWGMQIQGEAGGASRQYFYKNTFTGTIKSGPNTLYAPQGHGVRFNGSAKNIVLDLNTISDNQGAGIEITDNTTSNLRVIGNTITGNGGAAVDGSAANSLWAGNTVTANAQNNAPASAAGLAVPSATVSDEGKLHVGEPVKFSIHVSGIGSIVNVLWDFGEGVPVAGRSGTHTYHAPGTYRVTAIAWDASGAAAFKQLTINVSRSIP